MKLSIIIPVYKVEKYIKDCLESLFSQLDSQVEIIIVDDGSPDNSIGIAKNLVAELIEEKKNSFVFVEQKNQGQSIARNNAIKIARGKYIGFLDADDYISENYISTILNKIQLHHNIDIFSFKAASFEDKTGKVLGYICENLEAGNHINDEEFLKNVFKQCSWQSWSRVVKAELMKEHLFPEGILLEDVHVFAKLYLLPVAIFHIDEVLIYYRQRATSSVAKANTHLIMSYRLAIEFLESYRDRYREIVELSLYKLYVDLLVHTYTFYGLKYFLKELMSRKENRNKKVILPVFYTILMHTLKSVKR